MLSALLGKKIGMTQVYDEAGMLHPVTVVQAGPCSVLQVKTAETDGYHAVQIGFEDVKPHRAAKPQIGHAAKAEHRAQAVRPRVSPGRVPADLQVGATLTVEVFEGVGYVDVIGTTKGKGFAGVMKRHHFAGQPALATAPSASTAAPAPSAPTPPTAATAATSRRASAWPGTWGTSAAPAATTSSSPSTRKTTCC